MAKVPKFAHILFLPQGVKIGLSFALQAAVSGIKADFQTCHIWAWNLAIGQSTRSCTYTLFWPKYQKLHIYSLSTPCRESKLSLFSLYEQWFLRYGPIFKTGHIWAYETWPLAKVAHILALYSRGSYLSLFSLYGQRFPTYGPIFKLAIFGHET